MKRYIKPQVKVRCIDIENELMAASTGSGVDGGESGSATINTTQTINASGEVGAKQSIWDNME